MNIAESGRELKGSRDLREELVAAGFVIERWDDHGTRLTMAHNLQLRGTGELCNASLADETSARN